MLPSSSGWLNLVIGCSNNLNVDYTRRVQGFHLHVTLKLEGWRSTETSVQTIILHGVAVQKNIYHLIKTRRQSLITNLISSAGTGVLTSSLSVFAQRVALTGASGDKMHQATQHVTRSACVVESHEVPILFSIGLCKCCISKKYALLITYPADVSSSSSYGPRTQKLLTTALRSISTKPVTALDHNWLRQNTFTLT